MTTTKEFQLVDINKLVPYANNARTHNKEQILKLRSSLREFGFVNPVIIDKAYNVLAGHGRIEAAKEEGIAEVPCVLCHINLAHIGTSVFQKQSFNIFVKFSLLRSFFEFAQSENRL